MEKINKCPMCRMHQIVVYSEDIHVSLEEAFDVLHESSLEHDTLRSKADLLDEMIEWLNEDLRGQKPLSVREAGLQLLDKMEEIAEKAEALK